MENKKKIFFNVKVLAASAALAFWLLASAASQSGAAGTFDDASPKGMSEVLAVDAKLGVGDDELVIYYLRGDHNYSRWALWLWAAPGGDGAANFPHTQSWSELDGVGYMRIKLDGSNLGGNKPVSSAGDFGFIVRQRESWSKDGKEDRLWSIKTSNKVAVFSGDGATYAAKPYKPAFKQAEFTTERTIDLKLSGKYGLDPNGGPSGFVVTGSSGTQYPIKKVFNTESPNDASKNMAKKVTIELAAAPPITDNIKIDNEVFLCAQKVSNTKLAIKYCEAHSPAADEVLGCIYKEGNATFKLWAPTSSDAKVNLYPSATGKASQTLSMTIDEATGVWSATAAVADGTFYDYTLVNSKGTVTVLDPYALSMSANKNDGSIGRAAVIDLDSDKAGALDKNYLKISKKEDAIIYEISVRDFTISEDSGVSAPKGTYKAFSEKLMYLKDLGVTHIQLMPVVNFFLNDETNKKYEASGTVGGNNYNWGYDPHNYFTPEGWYSTDPADPYCRIRELRELIKSIHEAGMGVLLDVVYNHMASTQFLDDIVPGYYFRMTENGGFKSNSGCGNDTATEHKMMKKLVVDSTTHWVRDYGADGFRFDLMGLMEAGCVEDAFASCKKVNAKVLFEGEGWKMYNGSDGVGMDQNYMVKTNNVSVFNDELRDLIKAGGFNETGRGLITKKETDEERFLRNVTGNPMTNYRADAPGDNLNYLVCHDGLTLHDAIVNNLKLNETSDKAEIIKRIKLGNFIVLTSQGLAFLHGGQERGRTKPNVKGEKNECVGAFVRNSYDSSDNINQFVWTLDDDYKSLLDYTKGLVSVRKSVGALRMSDAKQVSKNIKLIDTKDDSGLVMAYSIKDGKDKYILIVNAKAQKVRMGVGANVTGATVLVDAVEANPGGIENPTGVELSGKSVTIEPLTATLIRAK